MKTHAKFLSIILSVFALCLPLGQAVAFAEQAPEEEEVNPKTFTAKGFEGFVFNTTYTSTVAADFANDAQATQNYNALTQKIKDYINSLEDSISTSVSTSSVYAFNQANAGATVEIDKTAYDVLSLAKDMYEFTEGYYNPAVYYSVDLYGFSPRTKGQSMPYDREGGASAALPKQKYVTAFQQLSGHFKDVTIEELNGKYYATKPQNAFVVVDGITYNLKVDLGGIGKGYAVDVINDMYEEYGFDYGYFSFGSSSIFLNKFFNSDEQTYNLGLTDPRGGYGETYATIKVKDACISTSGDYEKYYIIDDVRYSHLLNPYTGSPIRTGIMTATVIGGTAAEGDALTTAICAMGRDKAISFINEKLKDYHVVFTYESVNGKQLISDFIGADLSNTNIGYEENNNYQIKGEIDNNGNIVYTGDTEKDAPLISTKKGCNSSIVAGQSSILLALTTLIIMGLVIKKGKKCL